MNATGPENATERVVVLMSAKQKTEVTRRAKAARLSLSDFMRRQALGHDEVLSSVVTELRVSTANAMAALDHALSWVEKRKRPNQNAMADSHQGEGGVRSIGPHNLRSLGRVVNLRFHQRTFNCYPEAR